MLKNIHEELMPVISSGGETIATRYKSAIQSTAQKVLMISDNKGQRVETVQGKVHVAEEGLMGLIPLNPDWKVAV